MDISKQISKLLKELKNHAEGSDQYQNIEDQILALDEMMKPLDEIKPTKKKNKEIELDLTIDKETEESLNEAEEKRKQRQVISEAKEAIYLEGRQIDNQDQLELRQKLEYDAYTDNSEYSARKGKMPKKRR